MEEGSMKVREIGIQIFRECEECSYLWRKAFAKDLKVGILQLKCFYHFMQDRT